MAMAPKIHTVDVNLGCRAGSTEYSAVGKLGEFGSYQIGKTPYSLNLIQLDRPSHGHVNHTRSCPACGQAVQLRVNSRRRAILATNSWAIFGTIMAVGVTLAALLQKPLVNNFDGSTANAILGAFFGMAAIGGIGTAISLAVLKSRNVTQMSVQIVHSDHQHMLFDPENPKLDPWK